MSFLFLFIKFKNIFNNFYYLMRLFNFSFFFRYLISSFESLNPLLIVFTIRLFSFLSFVLYRAFNMTVGIWNLKCSVNNSLFTLVSFLIMSLLNLFISVFVGFLKSYFLLNFLLVCCSSNSSSDFNRNIPFLMPSIIFFLPS